MDIGRLDASVYPAVQNFCVAARALGIGLGNLRMPVIRLQDARVTGDIQLINIEVANLDLYGASAKDIWLNNAVDGGNPAAPPSCGIVDFGNTHVSGLMTIDSLHAERLIVRYTRVRAVGLAGLDVDDVDLLGCQVDRYLDISGSRIDRLTGNNIHGTADLRSTSPGGRASGAGAPESPPLPTRVGLIQLTGSQWSSVDLTHFLFEGLPPDGSAFVACQNIQVAHDFKLHASQFPKATSGDARILDISNGCIGRMDLGLPLPGMMEIKGARVASWGLEEESAKGYDAIMRCALIDQGAYLDLENRLENAGRRDEADALHRIWRRRVEDELLSGGPRVRSALHRIFLGYGTRSTRILWAWAFAAVTCWALVTWTYPREVQITPAALATLQECGARCRGTQPPALASTLSQRASDALQLVASSGLPIIDLGLARDLEPVPRTPAFWALALMKLLGWIIWPLFLTSAVAGFFPKRHRA